MKWVPYEISFKDTNTSDCVKLKLYCCNFAPLLFSHGFEFYNMTLSKHILYKIRCQRCHFILRFFRIPSPHRSPPSSLPPASPPPSSPVHRMAHGGVFQLHQVLERRIAKHASGVLRFGVRKRRACLKVHGDQGGFAGLAAVLGHLHFMGVLEEMHNHVAFVAGHAPLRPRGGIEDEDARLAFDALTDPERVERVLTGWVGAFITAHS